MFHTFSSVVLFAVIVTFPEPSKLAEPESIPPKDIVLAVANFVAVEALPLKVAVIVAGNFKL